MDKPEMEIKFKDNNTIQQQRDELTTLKSQVESLTERLQHLEVVNELQDKRIKDLERRNRQLEGKVTKCEGVRTGLLPLEEAMKAMEKTLHELEERTKDISFRRDNAEPLPLTTFSAGKRFATPVDLPRQNEWVKMADCDLVLVSCPNFRQAEVIFTAPVRGSYAFYAEVWQAGSGQLLGALQGIRGAKYFFGKTSGDATQCCGLAVVELAEMESVWVAVKRLGGTARVREYWFSGWLCK